MRRLPLLTCAALLVAAIAASSCESPRPEPNAALVVSPTGAYTLDGKAVSAENLEAELRALREREPGVMLFIETDRQMQQAEQNANKVVNAVAFKSVTYTDYREVAARSAAERRIEYGLFWGGIQLLAVLICAPYALSGKTPAQARRVGFLGVWGAGVLLALLIGAVMDILAMKSAPWGVGLNTLVLMIYAVPLSGLTGLLAGALFSAWVRRRG